MAAPKPPEPVTLIVGMLSARPELLDAAERELAELYGPLGRRSPLIDFDFTDYYEAEMGPNLLRKFVGFEKLVNPKELVFGARGIG